MKLYWLLAFILFYSLGTSASTQSKVNAIVKHNSTETTQSLPVLVSHRLLKESFEKEQTRRLAYLDKVKSVPFEEDGIFLQKMHLRYLMSSTAEQPDNSGRSSTFSIWLTILIAALAAAILS